MSNLTEKLEAKGEPTVRREQAQGLYGTPGSIRHAEVEAWLKGGEFQRQQQEGAERKHREDRAEHREELRDQLVRETALDAKKLARLSIAIAIIALLISLFRS